MSGDQWTARLSEYLDGEMTNEEQQALERHLADCADCRGTLAELRRVVMRARSLDDRPPTRDLWPDIAGRIGAGRPEPAVLPGPWRRVSVGIPQLAAAALVVAGLGAGAMWFAMDGAGPDGASPVASQAGPTAAQLAGMASYDAAVADLEQILAQRRDDLDSSTVRVLEESLATIDRAINRARAALEADPSDPYLKHHLAQAMRQKLDLLRRAADLAVAS